MKILNRKEFIQKVLGGGVFAFLGLSIPSESDPQEILQLPPFKAKRNEDYWTSVRKHFILDNNRNFFNNAGLGPSPKMVIDKVYERMLINNRRGEEIYSIRTKIRKKMAGLVNADPEEIAFTRNATEGMNMVAKELDFKKGDEIILTTHEHIGGASPWIRLVQEKGVKVKLIDLDLNGKDNFKLISESFSPNTKLLCFSHVTCTTGMLLPAKKLATFCKSRNVICCIDGAQAIGSISLDLHDIDPDFYVTSCHKWLLGPKGTGMLYISKRWLSRTKPVFSGAYSNSSFDLLKKQISFETNAQREEYGTRSSATLEGLGMAIDFHQKIGTKYIVERSKMLAKLFISRIKDNPEIEILSPEEEEFSTSMVTFRIRNKNSIEARDELSHIHKQRLRAIYENKLNALRACFFIYNHPSQIEELAAAVEEVTKG